MKFVIRRLPELEDDLLKAARWYDQRETGLGDEFLDEVEAAIETLECNALNHSVRFADVRRAPVMRFTFYGIYYLVRDGEVWVLSVFHGRRHPRWLRQRRGTFGKE